MTDKKLELALLRLWLLMQYEYVYKYKHRMWLFRDRLVGFELLYDPTAGRLFPDVIDIAKLDDSFSDLIDEQKVSIQELIQRREEKE